MLYMSQQIYICFWETSMKPVDMYFIIFYHLSRSIPFYFTRLFFIFLRELANDCEKTVVQNLWPGPWLFDVWDYTTQLYEDRPLWESLLTNLMECPQGFERCSNMFVLPPKRVKSMLNASLNHWLWVITRISLSLYFCVFRGLSYLTLHCCTLGIVRHHGL